MRLQATVLFTVAALAAPAAASPLQMFGSGGRSPGMAGTGVATPVDWDSVYLNPAGLATLTGRRLGTGVLYGSFDLNGVDRPIDDPLGISIGLSLPIPFGGALEDRVGFGVAVYFPPTLVTRLRAPKPGVPYFALLESRADVIGVQVGAGFKISDQWSVGVGILALGTLKGGLDIVSDASGRIAAVTEARTVTHMAPIMGARWKESSRMTIGLTVRLPSKASYAIDVESMLGDEIPVPIPDIQLAGVAQYDPLTVAAEVSWRATDALHLTGQLGYEAWRFMPTPSENPVIGNPPLPKPGFHDTVVPRIAVEWFPQFGRGNIALRGGYAFLWSPAPEMTGDQALLDNHRHIVSAGAGLETKHGIPIRIDLWTQLHLLVPRHHDRPEGMEDIDTSGWIVVLGATVGVDFE